MGRQDGLLQFTGSVANLSFYKTKDGYLVRKKAGVSGERIKSDPSYVRTRENLSEFARAGQAAKLLRSAFRTVFDFKADKGVSRRLVAEMVKVIREDAVNTRGQRNVIDGEAVLLQGFEFNENALLSAGFRPKYAASIDRAAGTMAVDVEVFSPERMISIPDGATHFQLKIAGAEIDFDQNSYLTAEFVSAQLPVSSVVQEPLHLGLNVLPASGHPLFLAFGIEFLQILKSGELFALNNGAFNAMAIAKVDIPVAG